MKHEGMRIFERGGLWLVLIGLAGCGESSGPNTDYEPPPPRVDAIDASSTSGSQPVDASGQAPLPDGKDRDAAAGPSEASLDAGGSQTGPSQPEGWDEDIALPQAEDLDPDPDVLEVEIEAREADIEILPGQTTRLWTYNGLLPGPLLRAKKGDRLIVHFTNQLPEPTTIHWHGVRVPATMDGTAAMQDPVQPGESFTNDNVIPDAGTYWYHPHLNETVQLERGLYGALIVRGDSELMLDGEQILVLDDLKLDKKGEIAKFGGLKQRHDGREGDVRLVNGQQEPELTIPAGQIERWRVVNASSARYVRLSIGGQPFRIIGTDGGRLEALDDQPDAERQLPHEDREHRDQGGDGDLAVDAEQRLADAVGSRQQFARSGLGQHNDVFMNYWSAIPPR